MQTSILPWQQIIPSDMPSPCFVVDENRLESNLNILKTVQKRTGAKILLALKGFAMFAVFNQLKKVLHGVCASSPYEARLGREEFGKEVHAFAAGYSESDIHELCELCDHIVFNSFTQYHKFLPLLTSLQSKGRLIQYGLRINPEHSEGTVPIYDPCSPSSRLGIRLEAFKNQDITGISGLHFHTLCEQDAAPLARTLEVVESKFGKFFSSLQWINFGGGHHITRHGYDIDLLCSCITKIRQKYNLEVYLEPGEAIALNTGVLVSTVLDIVNADMPVVILDTSATAHMPDVIEMPYKPQVIGASNEGEKSWTCRLAGKSCLAGDVIGTYSFDSPLTTGDKVIFLDMAHYTMVKTTTFNGLALPSIALLGKDNYHFRIIKKFRYDDFKGRLS